MYVLRQKEQKPEWSEEDEAAYDAFICEVVNKKMNPTIEQVKWLRSIRDRLKSLKPQAHWEPSEEQMCALLAVLNDPDNIGSQTCQLALTGLYDDLKKLK